MIKKYKFYIAAAMIAVLAIVIATSGDNREPEEKLTGNESTGSGNNNLPGAGYSGDALHGILQVSDNKELGNYKLVSELGDIYIRTNRDYGDLTGSEVTVAIDGIPESFRLIDIYVNPQ